MLKKEIKKLIKEMKDEIIIFYTKNGISLNQIQQDKIKKINNNEYSCYSSGQNWHDQIPTIYDQKEIIDILWNEKPYSYKII